MLAAIDLEGEVPLREDLKVAKVGELKLQRRSPLPEDCRKAIESGKPSEMDVLTVAPVIPP
jgi:hypothetical protein